MKFHINVNLQHTFIQKMKCRFIEKFDFSENRIVVGRKNTNHIHPKKEDASSKYSSQTRKTHHDGILCGMFINSDRRNLSLVNMDSFVDR